MPKSCHSHLLSTIDTPDGLSPSLIPCIHLLTLFSSSCLPGSCRYVLDLGEQPVKGQSSLGRRHCSLFGRHSVKPVPRGHWLEKGHTEEYADAIKRFLIDLKSSTHLVFGVSANFTGQMIKTNTTLRLQIFI